MSGRRPQLVGRFWQKLWERAPRQLSTTRSGRVLLGVALATGFAAINTGNNLLFLGWGLLLSGILVSGLLSEAALRSLDVSLRTLPQPRAREVGILPIRLENRSRSLPTFAVQIDATVEGPDGSAVAEAPLQLRVAPRAELELLGRFLPPARGAYTVQHLRAHTAYPFGFFEKTRRFSLSPTPTFYVLPPRVPVDHLLAQLSTRIGEAPLQRAGGGEDYFALRPYREGEDLRRISWRRSAKSGRWVIRENEAQRGNSIVLQLLLPERARAGDVDVESAIATCGSLAEVLLERGSAVGLWAPGVALLPQSGEAQRWVVLRALATLTPDAPMHDLPIDTPRVALAAWGVPLPPNGGVLCIGDEARGEAR